MARLNRALEGRMQNTNIPAISDCVRMLSVVAKGRNQCSNSFNSEVMECKDFEPSIIQDNENEYINISKAFSSSLVEKANASIALNSFVPINRVAEAKGLKSNRSLRLEINKPESKYIAREVKVNGGN